VKRAFSGLVLGSFVLAHSAFAGVTCFAIVPEGPVAVGEQVELGGGGFDAGTLTALFAGTFNIAGGTADASGGVTATYAFAAPGEYPIQVLGLVGGEYCASDQPSLLVEGDGELVSAGTVSEGFVPPLLTTTTSLVIGHLGYLDGSSVVVEVDDESLAPATTVAAATTDAPAVTLAAAPATEANDGTSILLLGAVTALVAGLLGVSAGWVLRRRRS
jgi:hypothetical protein